MQLFMTSFVAAIPGALLAYMAVMAFLNYAGGPNVAFQGVVALSLLLGATLAFMPAGVLVFIKPGDAPPKKKKPAKGAKGKEEAVVEAEAAPDDDGFELASEDALEVDAAAEVEAEAEPVADDELGSDMEISEFLDQSSVSEVEMHVVDDGSSAELEIDSAEFDDDLLDEPKPKPKKKK